MLMPPGQEPHLPLDCAVFCPGLHGGGIPVTGMIPICTRERRKGFEVVYKSKRNQCIQS